MINNIFRDRLINKVRYAVSEASNISEVNHSGLKGRFRELVIANMIQPMLPQGYSIGKGKICDQYGGLSSETDVVIYNSAIMPPIMYGEEDGIYPLESSFYSIEVKSTLNATEVKDTVDKGKKLRGLSSSIVQPSKSANGATIYPVVMTLFAFDSDLSESGKTELDRYAEVDKDWLVNPVLRVICVVGKGYWYYKPEPRQWVMHPATNQYDEVIGFVSGISNTLAKARLNTRIGFLGQYVMAERPLRYIS